jgi:hypothetical protein
MKFRLIRARLAGWLLKKELLLLVLLPSNKRLRVGKCNFIGNEAFIRDAQEALALIQNADPRAYREIVRSRMRYLFVAVSGLVSRNYFHGYFALDTRIGGFGVKGGLVAIIAYHRICHDYERLGFRVLSRDVYDQVFERAAKETREWFQKKGFGEVPSGLFTLLTM